MAARWGVEYETSLRVKRDGELSTLEYSSYIEFETLNCDAKFAHKQAWERAVESARGVIEDVERFNTTEWAAVKSLRIDRLELL